MNDRNEGGKSRNDKPSGFTEHVVFTRDANEAISTWTGKFVSQYHDPKNGTHQGLIFKRLDGELHHFSGEEARQMRAGENKALIERSMQNGSQGKDLNVTFSQKNGRDGSWTVEPAERHDRIKR